MAELEVHVLEEAHSWRPEPSWRNMVIPLIIIFAAIALAFLGVRWLWVAAFMKLAEAVLLLAEAGERRLAADAGEQRRLPSFALSPSRVRYLSVV